MTVLEELLVRLGVDLAGAESDIDSSADRIDRALDDVEASAESLGHSVAEAADDTAAALDEMGDSAARVEGEAQQAANGVEGALGGIAATAAGVAVGALFMEGLNSAMDMGAATHKLQAGLDLTAAEAQRAGDLAGDVFSAGFSDSVTGASDALGAVIGAMGDVGDFTDAELRQMTKSAIALGDTFEMDIPEAATAAGALIKQGLVKDGTEAFDVLTKAAQTLPASMAADIPAIVTEYGTHFKRIGLDAQTAFGMMSQFVQAGGRDIDQAADVLHEFARITSEETDRAAQGFKDLGLDAGKMLSDIGKGGKPAADALTLTLQALRGVKDPAKQAQLGVALFGDMAGEAAGALLAMDPATAAAVSGMDKAAGAASRVTEGMEHSPAQQFDSIMRTLSMTLGQTLAPALSAIAGFLAEHPGLVGALVPVVLALAAGLAVAAVAQWAMNSAMLAWPGTWIILAVLAVAAAFVLLWKRSETFRNIALGVWAAVRFGIAAAVNGVLAAVAWLGKLPGKISGWFGQAKDYAIRKVLELVAWLTGLPGRVTRAVSGLFDGIPGSFRGAINSVIRWWNNLSFTIGGGEIMGVDVPSITLHTPNIPFLAKGGIATAPTLAMVGEGREDEAIMPLSRLQQLIDTTSAPSVTRVQPTTTRLLMDVTGADEDMKRLITRIVRIDGGGDVQAAFT
ncbi:phage tail tape measure protein [Streptomyces sp. NPDC006132]|uniref:phage tail tape measure protein n=1 Tax=Streptomyces sp. NPDC006132 TaxID=3156732 RepID=UPI0033F8C09E